MNISQKGIDFIKGFESFRAKMYLDAVGLPTIGYGTLIDTAEEEYLKTTVISEEQAEALLKRDLAHVDEQVPKMLRNMLLQNQYDALVSFAYNCGLNNLRNSTLLKKVNENPNDPTIANEFGRWIHGAGAVLPGLIRRRGAEAKMYFNK